jgi:hypothetical protein
LTGAGNFLNDAFAIFPHVEPEDTFKKLLYHMLGVGFIAAQVFYCHQIYVSLVKPIVHNLR